MDKTQTLQLTDSQIEIIAEGILSRGISVYHVSGGFVHETRIFYDKLISIESAAKQFCGLFPKAIEHVVDYLFYGKRDDLNSFRHLSYYHWSGPETLLTGVKLLRGIEKSDEEISEKVVKLLEGDARYYKNTLSEKVERYNWRIAPTNEELREKYAEVHDKLYSKLTCLFPSLDIENLYLTSINFYLELKEIHELSKDEKVYLIKKREELKERELKEKYLCSLISGDINLIAYITEKRESCINSLERALKPIKELLLHFKKELGEEKYAGLGYLKTEKGLKEFESEVRQYVSETIANLENIKIKIKEEEKAKIEEEKEGYSKIKQYLSKKFRRSQNE